MTHANTLQQKTCTGLTTAFFSHFGAPLGSQFHLFIFLFSESCSAVYRRLSVDSTASVETIRSTFSDYQRLTSQSLQQSHDPDLDKPLAWKHVSTHELWREAQAQMRDPWQVEQG